MSRKSKHRLNKVRTVGTGSVGQLEGQMKVLIGQTKVQEVRIWVNIRVQRSKHGPNDGTRG